MKLGFTSSHLLGTYYIAGTVLKTEATQYAKTKTANLINLIRKYKKEKELAIKKYIKHSTSDEDKC